MGGKEGRGGESEGAGEGDGIGSWRATGKREVGKGKFSYNLYCEGWYSLNKNACTIIYITVSNSYGKNIKCLLLHASPK